jgi:hypothetical protein
MLAIVVDPAASSLTILGVCALMIGSYLAGKRDRPRQR